jgi:hypothetical protein
VLVIVSAQLTYPQIITVLVPVTLSRLGNFVQLDNPHVLLILCPLFALSCLRDMCLLATLLSRSCT